MDKLSDIHKLGSLQQDKKEILEAQEALELMQVMETEGFRNLTITLQGDEASSVDGKVLTKKFKYPERWVQLFVKLNRQTTEHIIQLYEKRINELIGASEEEERDE